MNIIDIIILLVLLMGAVVGFKQGAIKKLTSFVGTFVIIIIAFMFKNQLSVIFYENLPFLNFWGAFQGIEILNIIFYEIIAFLFIFCVLLFVLRVLLVVSGILETLLKFTVILSIPSKILGIFVGIIEYYVYTFIVLFIISLPVFNIDILNDSKYADTILNETPFLSTITSDTVLLYKEVYTIVDNRENKSVEKLNEEVLTFMLDNNIVTYNSAIKLVEKNKIHLEDTNFIEKYNK